MMRALVLGGAGAVCKEATRDLSQFSHFSEIVVADQNAAGAIDLVESLQDPRLRPLQLDARDDAALRAALAGFDVVVNGLPYEFDYRVNKACVEVGVSGLDLSSDDPQFALHEQAVERDILFVPGMGATPGTTNMMVRRAAEILDRLDRVEIYFAAFRSLAPAPGLLQTTLWEFDPEVDERAAVYFEDGRWLPAAPLSGSAAVRFHELIGEQTVYYVPHDEANTLPRSYPTLHRAAVRGCFPPHVMAVMSALSKADMLSGRIVTVDGVSLPARELVRALLAGSPATSQNPVWAYGLVVEVYGERAGRTVRCRYRNRHPGQENWGGEAAYYKNVGIPLSVGAQMIATGQIEAKGVRPPELAFPSGPFFEALARRGIIIEETIEDHGELASPAT